MDQDNDDNEKESKINRQSRGFLQNALILVATLTVVGLIMGYIHTHDPPQLSKNIQHLVEKWEDNLVAHESAAQGQLRTPPIATKETPPEKTSKQTEFDLTFQVEELDQKVRARKSTEGVLMETDPEGLRLTKKLQAATLKLLKHRYGYGTKHERFRVRVDLVYPEVIVGEGESKKAFFVIEMAPPSLIPCSVFYFMEMVRTYKSGSFHRNADHVLQINAQTEATAGHKSMPFQEYSPEHPHKKYTTGYAGRPSGPGWYVSIKDNTKNHGPGSQQKHNPYEADANFGRVVEGIKEGVIDKMHSVPQKGWLDKDDCIIIPKMTILVQAPDDELEWIEWTPDL